MKKKQRKHILSRNTKLSEFDEIKPAVIDHLSKIKTLRLKQSRTNAREFNETLFNFC